MSDKTQPPSDNCKNWLSGMGSKLDDVRLRLSHPREKIHEISELD